MDRSGITTKTVVRASIMAALYFVFVVALAPISFGPLQFRAANILKGLAIVDPAFALGYGLGNFFANQASPFGILDWAVMPVFDVVAALLAYSLRKLPALAVFIQSFVIAAAVSVFPLGIGGNVPFLVSFPGVFVSTLIIISVGYVVLVPVYRQTNSLQGGRR